MDFAETLKKLVSGELGAEQQEALLSKLQTSVDDHIRQLLHEQYGEPLDGPITPGVYEISFGEHGLVIAKTDAVAQ